MRFYTVPHDSLRRVAVGMVMVLLLVLLVVTIRQPGTRPVTTPPSSERYSLRDVTTSHKALALTFDISWGTVMPPKVFKILLDDHVHATIFVSGPWAKQHATLVKEMARAGMEIESHGWAHVNYSGLGAQGVQANIQKTDDVIRSITGVRPSFVRPPNGDFNRQSIAAAHAIGYTTVTWGTDSLDWMNPGVATIIRRVVSRSHPGDIVLLHASDTCKQTDLALPTIIQELRGQGYKLVTLKTLMTLGQPNYRG